MVNLTLGVSAFIPEITTGGTGIAAAFGAVTGIRNAVFSRETTASAVVSAAGAGAVIGAISGAATSVTVEAAVVGAGIGGTSAAAVTLTGAGMGGMAAGLTAGALLLTLGVSEEPTTPTYTFDCWKPVVRDASPDPSNGRLLREIVEDPRVKQVITSATDDSSFPEIILENIWNEKFRIEYVLLPSDQWAAHAVLLSP